MKYSYEILRAAFKLYCEREKYAYFYDAKGVRLTDATMDYLINLHWDDHFKRYNEKELEAIKNYSRGKIGFDCSGFIYAISGLGGSSKQCYDACYNKDTSVNGKAGSLLWKPGHVGIDIGYGYTMHCPIEGHTFEIAKIQSVGFTSSGEIPGYNYEFANNF